MKSSTLAITVLTALLTTTSVSAQGGPLTPPPGAPAPTMKPLNLVEPRIPLVAGAPGVIVGASGRIDITQPGSYYLTKDLQVAENIDGIVIFTSGVSLDLMGYSIIAQASGFSDTAISVNPNHSNISIQNGHIVSTTTFAGNTFTPSGFGRGILVQTSNNNVSVRNITVRGTRIVGILMNGEAGTVQNCSVFISAGVGISNPRGIVAGSVVHTAGTLGIDASVVSNCRVNHSLGTGITADAVSNSFAQSTGTASSGISAITVENSVGITSGLHGIAATTVSNCRGQSTNPSSGNHGISAGGGQVSGSSGIAAGGHGISAASVSDSVGSTSGANGVNSSGISANRVGSSQGTANNASGGRGIIGSFSVTSSYGNSAGLQGIHSIDGTVSDSYGISSGSTATSRGIDAQIVTNSRGRSTNASGREGIRGNTLVMNSIGESSGNSGIFANRAATNCYGYTSHTADTSHGILSNGTVTSSYGWSNGTSGGDGINSNIVTGSYGYAATGARHGITSSVAESSVGQRQTPVAGRFGLVANRASICFGSNGESIAFRYNMP